MDFILKAIELVKGLFEIADVSCRNKSGKERLRIAFHCGFDADCVPRPELRIVNCGDHPQTVEYLFAVVGCVLPKKIPVFVKWGFPDLPQVVPGVADGFGKVVLRLADRGTIKDIAAHRFIRFGCVTDMGDVFVGRFLREWEKVELREAVGVKRKSQ